MCAVIFHCQSLPCTFCLSIDTQTSPMQRRGYDVGVGVDVGTGTLGNFTCPHQPLCHLWASPVNWSICITKF
uniref:Uncharacterized protein n=1 Tax=Anguilla anguilla TaxID=7936 RepID=A0A0E9WZW2_ANGAN